MTEPMQIAYIAAIAGVSGAVVGACANLFVGWLTLRNQTKTRESEERRWYLSYFVAKKIETLSDLHAALVSYSQAFPSGWVGFTQEYFWQQVKPTQDNFLRAKALAALFLDDAGQELMTDIEHDIRTVVTTVLGNRDDKLTFEGTPYYEKCKRGLEYLRSHLNHKTLDQIEKGKW